MVGEKVIKKVAKVITQEVERRGAKVVKILLFGSRARGTARHDSDWDFLVIVDKEMSFNEKWEIIDAIKLDLAKMGIPNDIIIKSEKEIELIQNDVGRISYYALKEGVEL